MRRIVFVGFVFALGTGGVAYYEYALTPPPNQYVVGIDSSLSVKRNCGGLASTLQRLIAAQGGVREGSKVTLLGIGQSGDDREPVRLLDKALPTQPDAVFGRDDAAFHHEKQSFFDAVQSACEAAPATRHSPVLRLVSEGLAHLRSRGPKPNARGYFLIQTDLRDDTDEALRAVIERSAKHPSLGLPKELARSLDNAGVNVEFCGTAETRPQRGAHQAYVAPETLQRIWLGLFTHPELVSFQPFCGL